MEGKIINALVSGICNVFSIMVPQNATGSYVTYQIISGDGWDSKSGAATVDAVRIQVNCNADNYSDAATLAKNVRDALEHQSGVIAGITVQNIYFKGKGDLYDEELNRKGKSLDFEIIKEN